jgi:hypothetical protein
MGGDWTVELDHKIRSVENCTRYDVAFSTLAHVIFAFFVVTLLTATPVGAGSSGCVNS